MALGLCLLHVHVLLRDSVRCGSLSTMFCHLDIAFFQALEAEVERARDPLIIVQSLIFIDMQPLCFHDHMICIHKIIPNVL